MNLTWSEIQLKRLKELNATAHELNKEFQDAGERNGVFQQLEGRLAAECRQQLQQLRDERLRPRLCRLESELTEALNSAGFVQVATPTIMSRGHLAKMSIDAKSPLYEQVFWLDRDRCLRPMLAPHLYYVLKDLLRLWEKPVRIFEVGSCFRKESQGAKHAAEFTMLNLVEMGLPLENRRERLEELAHLVTRTAGITDYKLETHESVVYGETIDIVAGEEDTELGSGAMGPHPLDRPWKIMEPWVGIGFGLERLLMVRDGSVNLASVGRSLAYLDGFRLNV